MEILEPILLVALEDGVIDQVLQNVFDNVLHQPRIDGFLEEFYDAALLGRF
jgi:hypothetical protein